jgi:hypothetical protein
MHTKDGIVFASAVKRLFAAALGFFLTILSILADAKNVIVTSCACVTTADYTSAVRNQATFSGTFMISSTTRPSSAIMAVTGKWEGSPRDPTWVPTVISPVDANGNSLAGESEAQLEAAYSAIDQTIMETSRDFPIILGPIQPGQTQSAVPSFLTSTDDDIWLGVATDSMKTDPSFLAEVQAGDTVTITWQYATQGTITATFQVIVDSAGHLTLKWKSATKNGKPINRDGSSKQGSTDAGASTGSIAVNGFGSGADWTWSLVGDPQLPGVSITVGDPLPDGEGGDGNAPLHAELEI